MRRIPTLALLFLWAPSVAAQGIERLERGDSVRLTAPVLADTVITGEVYHVDPGAILITQADTQALRTVRIRDIQTLERQMKGPTASGVLGGLVGGAALGAGVSALALGEAEGWEGLGHVLLIGGAGIGGAVIGYFVGSALSWDARWYEVELPPAEPMVAVQPTGRFNVGVSIPLRR
jgi:hypothetical protein